MAGSKKDVRKENMDLSVIIPVYNQANEIEVCVKTLLKQEKHLRKMQVEVLLIDDGSEDGSDKVCERLSRTYPQVRFFVQENRGVSAARNVGIRNAIGKYMFFLDADDKVSPGTMWQIKNFFDQVAEETDLVTYPIETLFEGRVLKPHFRYDYLKESGVYDLREYPYIGQTTMNIVVKNRYEENVLFDERQTFSEDQRYCCEVLRDKLKMGFCAEGKYIYYRSDSSASGRLSGACFVFEQCTKMFEDIFSWYEGEVPAAFQGLFMNDFYWKLCCNMLFPYHYQGRSVKEYLETRMRETDRYCLENDKLSDSELQTDMFEYAVERLRKLLDRCDNQYILEHPNIDFFEKYYMLRMKHDPGMTWQVNEYGFGLFHKDVCTVFENSIEIVMTKCKVLDGKVKIQGFLKSVFFQIYPKMPMLMAVENDGRINQVLQLRPSTHNYYLSHEETQRFWAFTYECSPAQVQNVKFEMQLEGRWIPTHYYFMPCVPFSHTLQKYDFQMDGVALHIDADNQIRIRQEEVKFEPVYLYYDCAGVAEDNGLLQFLKDITEASNSDNFNISENPKTSKELSGDEDICADREPVRYYVISDERQWEKLPSREYGITFGSKKHKELFLKCTRIYTAFIEEKNLIPFEDTEYEQFADQFQFEVIYLQHGVLHIEMPWKYSSESLLADKVVVSTPNEATLYMKYGFEEKQLIRTGMPRFQTKPVKNPNARRILLAPSWRSYLVGKYIDHRWEPMDRKFVKSNYYLGLRKLLESDTLKGMLEKYNLELDVKLHPIFLCYQEYFKDLPERVHMVDHTEKIGEYKAFITDFSSYMYDFVHADIPVFLYLPDVDEFRCGMNGYREIADEEYWDKVYEDEKTLINVIMKNEIQYTI